MNVYLFLPLYPYITIFQSFGLIPFFIVFQTTDCIYTQKHIDNVSYKS